MPSLLRSFCASFVLWSILGCAASPNGGEHQNPRIDPEIRRIAAAHPDSVIFLLMRTAAPLRAEDRTALAKAGVSTGSEIGDIVTGRMRAGDFVRLQRLRFLAVVQLSRDVPVTSTRE